MLNDEVLLLVDKLTKHIQSKIITTDNIHRYTYPVDDYFMDVYAEDIDELLKYIFKKDYDKQKVLLCCYVINDGPEYWPDSQPKNYKNKSLYNYCRMMEIQTTESGVYDIFDYVKWYFD